MENVNSIYEPNNNKGANVFVDACGGRWKGADRLSCGIHNSMLKI